MGHLVLIHHHVYIYRIYARNETHHCITANTKQIQVPKGNERRQMLTQVHQSLFAYNVNRQIEVRELRAPGQGTR
jgi:hypothetical protein